MAATDQTGLNAAYVAQLLEDYLDAPASVPDEWRRIFEDNGEPERGRDGDGAVLAEPPPPAEAPRRPRSRPRPRAAAPAATGLPGPARAGARGGRRRRPRRRRPPRRTPSCSAPSRQRWRSSRRTGCTGTSRRVSTRSGPSRWATPRSTRHGLHPPLTPELQERIPARLLRLSVPGNTLLEALPHLRDVYMGSIAYEIEHISDHAERVWLRKAIESGRFRVTPPSEQRIALLRRLSQVEGFEQYLRRSFLGQKQFSLEGLDVLVPMLDEAIGLAAEGGAHEVVIGMAHRGRLNALVHTVGRSYESVLREFEGERSYDALVVDPEGGSGDVKYHLPATGTRITPAGEIDVTIAPNPSHLEAVDPVVEGWTRAEQTDRSGGAGLHDPTVALAILIHGDAAFPGQGVVAETFNLQSLEGYSTGGTLHVITNNQVGFTTDPVEGRSTRYSSDLAKGFDVPIVHVNADDPEAALSAVRLALAYRAEFGHDFVIDLVGYRRFGHQEQDEAAYTQPLQVERIESQPTVRERYAEQLAEEGIITPEEAQAVVDEAVASLRAAHERLRASIAEPPVAAARDVRSPTSGTGDAVETAVAADRLRSLNEQLLRVPDGFTVHPKLARQLERRRETIEEGGIDWGQGEALAFASLLEDGIPIRLSGQDTERGTFAHRHLVLHDPDTGETVAPIQHLDGANASFEVYNSPLSEYAALGFEYGYSVAVPDALVLWEAQFGDFVNGAQIVIDQFIVAGRSKWKQTSRLTLLLPHGYEGNGPEHSSARLERFLQLGAQENIRVANCTTAAQFFHLLRRQALDVVARPLVLMTPEGASPPQAGLVEPRRALERPLPARAGRPAARTTRPSSVSCCAPESSTTTSSGTSSASRRAGSPSPGSSSSIPFPVTAVESLLASYPRLREVVWAQEEPQNMGPWRSIRHRLEEVARTSTAEGVQYVGRTWKASPSEGYPTAHQREQDRIVRQALGVPG